MKSRILIVGAILLAASTIVQSLAQVSIDPSTPTFNVQEGHSFSINILKTGTTSNSDLIKVVVQVSQADIQKNGGNDFFGDSQATTFSPGSVDETKQVSFFVADDDLPENTETFTLSLMITGGDAELGTVTNVTVNILANDDAFGVFSFVTVSPMSVSEGDTASLQVMRDRGTFETVTLNYQVTGSVNPSLDITPVSGKVIFNQGEQSKTIQLSIVNDQVPENDETYTVTLSIDSGAGSLNRTVMQIIILENDAPIRFTQNEYKVEEGQSNMDVRISVSRGLQSNGQEVIGPVNGPASVDYEISAGTATKNTDFIANDAFLRFGSGVTVANFTVTILADNIPEIGETFTITLKSPSGDVVLSSPSLVTVTILANDDENGVLSFKSPDAISLPKVQINEDTTGLTNYFRVVRSSGTFGLVSVGWEVVRNDSNTDQVTNDLTPASGTATLADGHNETVIALTIVADSTPEPSETYMIRLLPQTVTGGAKVEGILEGLLVIEDSDNAYGQIVLADDSQQKLITTTDPRKLEIVVERTGGTLEDVVVSYTVEYKAANIVNTAGVLNVSNPSSVVIPAGQATVTFSLDIYNGAFLSVGAQFDIMLNGSTLSQTLPVGPFNSPILGAKTTSSVMVTSQAANGEIGFESTETLYYDEPDNSGVQVSLPLTREGTNGQAIILWELRGSGANAASVTSTDTGLPSGSVIMASGESTKTLVITIQPDDIPETNEEITVTLVSVDPPIQKLRVGSTQVKVIIRENDNPGGTFQFSSAMFDTYTLQEEGEAVVMSVVRTGGSLVARQIEYYIEPNGVLEFYGSTGVLDFEPGDMVHNRTFIAKGDGVPELTENFSLKLRSYGLSNAVIGSRDNVNITVLPSNDPNGILVFDSNELVKTIGETKIQTHTAVLRVVRQKGTFGTVVVDWVLTPSNTPDVTPLSGQLIFGNEISEKTISITSTADVLPEEAETVYVNLTSASGGARLGTQTVATVIIQKNDDAIYFKAPAMTKVPEGSSAILTVVRDGNANLEAKVYYRTIDGTAVEAERDYSEVTQGLISFGVGETEKNVSLVTLQDITPETDETFIVQLFNPEGDVVVYGTVNATVVIMANDNANGIFSFGRPLEKSAGEGTLVAFEVTREQGRFGTVQIFWEILDNNTMLRVPDNEDFVSTTGFITFQDGDSAVDIEITAAKDSIPEYAEAFVLHLVNATGGGPSGQTGHLGTSYLQATIVVVENDDPYGVFAFPASSRQLSITEDYYPGSESSSVANFTIERMQGLYGNVEVLWEVFSDAIAGTLPSMMDLLFLADVPPSMISSSAGREGTTTRVVAFGNSTGPITVPAQYQTPKADIESGFSLAARVRILVSMDGFIVAKTDDLGDKIYYGLKVSTTTSTHTFDFHYATMAGNTVQINAVQFSINEGIMGGTWHHVVLTVDGGQVTLYLDGTDRGTRTVAGQQMSVTDGNGPLMVGAQKVGLFQFTGFMQDVRVFSRKLDLNEIKELNSYPSIKDVGPIAGSLSYPPGTQFANVIIRSKQDIEEERNEVFSLKLISAKGGARVSGNDASGKLTVLKSDNANGLFGFDGPCVPTEANENTMFNCVVKRDRGDAGTVTVDWKIYQLDLNGATTLALDDFSTHLGQLVFVNGDREETITFQVKNDNLPELTENFSVRLMAAMSDDGLVGSTNTSGASINPAQQSSSISVRFNDYPYGLLQFTNSTTPPGVSDPMILPATLQPEVRIPEENGTATLMVVRAQGLIGDVSVEWRTVDGVAKSAGKTPPDFTAAGGTLLFAENQKYGFINVAIIDNNIPEDDKSFEVELHNPSGGAEIGLGRTIKVVIENSDDAYGVFSVADNSLAVTAQETGDISFNTVDIMVSRTGGTIGTVDVEWMVTDDSGNDLVEDSGIVRFNNTQNSAAISIKIAGDTLPELDESFTISLVAASKGRLTTDASKLTSTLTVVANDDPYGIFIIPNIFRPMKTAEGDSVVTVEVQRLYGTYGTVRVNFTTLSETQYFNYLPGNVKRADASDFTPSQGALIFQSGETRMNFNVSIKDDTVPETDETVFVILTGFDLLQASQIRGDSGSVQSSPRLGADNLRYAQIIIMQNDNANGVLSLSAPSVSVAENFTGNFVSVVRSDGDFGEVTVKFTVQAGSATYAIDYMYTSTDVVLRSGEREKAVPVQIINDMLPELEETFTIQLLDQVTGGAVLGTPSSCAVIIQPSDDPNGLFEFAIASQTVDEQQVDTNVNITIVRQSGLLDVVAVLWRATLNGGSASSDITPVNGTIYFISSQSSQNIILTVKPDDIPEGQEEIIVTLYSATNGGRIGANNKFTLVITPNDNPHGVVQFQKDNFFVSENRQDSTQNIVLDRLGGTVGQLRVTYSTSDLDIISVATSGGLTIDDYFNPPVAGIKPLQGTVVDLTGQVNPAQYCATVCLQSKACQSYQYDNTILACKWFTVADASNLDLSTTMKYYIKDNLKAIRVYESLAESNADYTRSTGSTILISDGDSSGVIPMQILADDYPELNEKFKVTITHVELTSGPPSNPANNPQVGSLSQATVTISANDDANGMFRIYSQNPQATNGGSEIAVNEAGQLSVSLTVEREGGSIGDVSVMWSTNTQLSSASKDVDYVADGATLNFASGETRQALTIGIKEDSLPENDETIIVQLSNPLGGAILGDESNVTVTIKANDYVAGRLGFSTSSIIAEEGQAVVLKVTRTAPALGTVTAHWTIQAVSGHEPSQGFQQYTGSLTFQQGELSKDITLNVLADSTPEVNEEYRIVLHNLSTLGIRDTGEAAVDPSKYISSITIKGSNEPHGLFSFAANSLNIRTDETNATVRLTIDRKFGAIGTVRVMYNIMTGHLTPLSSDLVGATGGADFVQGIQFVDLADGVNSATVDIDIIDDNNPEIDEVFIVNLTAVTLISSTNSNFQPKLASTGTVAEIIIDGNDGTKGKLRFVNAVFSVNETNANYTLTVLRDLGTFGDVSVFYYAQSVSSGIVPGSDFAVVAQNLFFAAGESTKHINIQIFDDTEAEPEEVFEVILASPTGGVEIGEPRKAVITILGSDGASGYVTFDSTDDVVLTEPTDSSTVNSIAELRLSRGPGFFGQVDVPFEVVADNGQPVLDLTPSSGFVTFPDKQATATLTLTVVSDNLPELDESFTVRLKDPQGGASLGSITERKLTISSNDSPYGLLQVYVADSQNSQTNVEEDTGLVYLDVIRSQGTLGRITAQLQTNTDTATASSGPDLVLSPLDMVHGEHVRDWHSFESNGITYMVMLSADRVGLLTTGVGSSGSDGNVSLSSVTTSVLFRWQGAAIPVQSIETDGAVRATSFTENGKTYLVIVNHGKPGAYETTSRVYSVNQDGTLTVLQNMPTRGATDANTFKVGSERYMVITNYGDNSGQTSINSDVYKWDSISGRFLSTAHQYLSTLGASAVDVFSIDGDTYMAIANLFGSGSYEIDSIIYKLGPNNLAIQKQRLPSKGAVDMTSFTVGGTTYLVVANSRNNAGSTSQDSTIYKWDATTLQFVTAQNIPTSNVRRVNAFTASNGIVHLAFANLDGQSEIYAWDVNTRLFTSRWKGDAANNLSPMSVSQSAGNLVLIGSAAADGANMTSNVYLTAMLGISDFVPKTVMLTFEPGQTKIATSVEVLGDDYPEDTESFTVSLTQPTGGAEIGGDDKVVINILSNDDAHGVVEFAEDSIRKSVEETVNANNPVTLNVVRTAGTSGHVIVRWSASGQHDGINDITPIDGTVEFADGESIAQIIVTIKNDLLPELDELTLIQLTDIVKSGTTLSGRGAKIGQRNTASLTVLANDSPHGVVGWEQTTVTTTEPEGSDSTVFLHLVREQGLQGEIQITYMTSRATSLPSDQQAISGQDYVSTQAVVNMADGVTRVGVEIAVKSDNEPEAAETFLVDITEVKLVGSTSQPDAAPSIKQTASACSVTITENDNARGVVQFNVTRDADGTVKTYEGVGSNTLLKLSVLRSIGYFGTVTVSWQAAPREANNDDFTPPGGLLTFSEGQKTADVEIYIIDDQIAEAIETFDVELISATGGAQLGADVQVRVSIQKNDSPNGMFGFAVTQKSVRESTTNIDPLGSVSYDVVRTQGSEGTVIVEWRLEAAAKDDFFDPLSGSLTFGATETRKTIRLQTKPDAILEGEERFTISLVSATNNGDISPLSGDATIVILPDEGASGIVAILPDYRSILIGEPTTVYNGRARIDITRGTGIFGRVRVEWAITPRDLTTFSAVNGAVYFEDGQQVTSIEIQTKDDSTPEVKKLYTLGIVSAADGAKVSTAPGASSASILVVASDYPHGSFEFQSPAQVTVSEDSVQVPLTIMRNWGSAGQVKLSYTTSSGTATSDEDFDASSGSLTFSNGQTQQMLVITLKGDDIPEGPENFYVNLTSLELQSPTDNNYTMVQGLQEDLPPVMGQLSVKTIVIDKNDNAEGTLTFDVSAVNFQVAENVGIARVPVIRQAGSFGAVEARYTSRNLTAEKDVDYILSDGVIKFGDGMTYNTINVTIRDDSEQEMGEQLEITLTEAMGGASLGDHKVSMVTILKSDYPNGKFGFNGQTEITIPNPATNRELTFSIGRTEGFKGKQTLKWQIMGPDNIQKKLLETNDIAFIDNGRELTQGEMVWENGEGSFKTFKLTVKPYSVWEVKKTFYIEIYDIQSQPSGPENGEISPTTHTVTLTVLKHGDPNGIVRFDGIAQVEREFNEPTALQGALQVKFPIYRSEGTIRTQQVHWEVRGPADEVPDIQPMSGVAMITDETRNGEIILQVLADDVPELSEKFQVVLTGIEGGAEIDQTKNTSTIVIKYNDNPHGIFSLESKYQAVIVNTIDLSRKVLINITRSAGSWGQVRVSFGVVYDQSKGDTFQNPPPIPDGETGIAYVPSSSSVTFDNMQKSKLAEVLIGRTVFLSRGTTFTVTLANVQYIGSDETIPPQIAAQYQTAKVAVPQEAANSEVGFQTVIVNVDDAAGTATVVVERIGAYGQIGIDWQAGYPIGSQPQGFTRGLVIPSSGKVQFSHGQSTKSFTVSLTSQANTAELFALHMPNDPTTVAGGGAKLRSGYTITEIEPMGVVQLAVNSRLLTVTEDVVEVTLELQRLYGTLNNIKIRYSTVSGSANAGADYGQILESAVTMNEKSTSAQIIVQIMKDNVPENAEDFFVNLNSVFQLPTAPGDVFSPRLSQLYNSSRIIIASNSDPNGVLSIEASPQVTEEVPSVIQLTVYRKGGKFGAVNVRVRSIGGKESWSSQVPEQPGQFNNTVGQLLGNRNKLLAATAGQDYRQLDEVVNFKDGQEQAQVSIPIYDDNIPESNETVVIYLSEVTGGARIAAGSSDGGLTGYTVITIKRNDVWNGYIGFAPNSLFVTADEDGSARADLTLERKNVSVVPYEARLGWRADFSYDPSLSDDLVATFGEVICPAFQSSCQFSVHLQNDTIPEFKSSFTVQLYNPGEGVEINLAAQKANVTVVASDDPNGLIQFAQDSRIKYVEKNARTLKLRVDRMQGKTGSVNISYTTRQLANNNLYMSGVKVYPALEKADYTAKSGVLLFNSQEVSKYIDIVLNPITASDNPLPKLFQVVLSNPTNGARLNSDYQVSNITIVEDGQTAVWDVGAMVYAELTDDNIDNILNELETAVQGNLADDQMVVVETILQALIAEGETRRLSSTSFKNFLDVFCTLLTPTRDDATKGRHQLRPIYERFAFITLHGKTCETPLEQYSECSNTRFSVGRLVPANINGYRYQAERQDYLTIPTKRFLNTGENEPCKDIGFLEYNSEQWFSNTGDTLLSNKVISAEIKNTESKFIDEAVTFRVSTPDGSIATRRAQCVYYDDVSNSWRGNVDVCTVTNNLDLGLDAYVECSCKHMSSYAVKYTVKDPNIVGYPVWFHVSCFICMAGLVLAILSHHICSRYTMFSASLLMHMCFAALATQLCYVIAAYVSTEYILVRTTAEDNYRCIVMGVFMHYFFLAQFTWMLTQAVNFFKILVMNDEHTDRKYVLFFLLGWGTPAVIVGVFYAVTYVIYRQFGMPVNFIYGDVNTNRDMCFITNGYAALGGLIGPVLICVFVVAICFTKAFQVTPQWQAYDDVYRGRYNIKEVKTILFFWAIIIVTWIFGGLHMAIGHLWMLIFFVVFNIIQGLYAFIVYTALRNPCLPCFRPQKASYTLDINESGSPPIMYINPAGSVNGSIKGSRASLINESWEQDSIGIGIPGSQMRVKRSPAPANVYSTGTNMHSPDDNEHDPESQDFDDLIFALKTGGSFTPDDSGLDPAHDEDPSASEDQQYGMRRISIADTHL